ncbi:CBS-domain-containing protein [Coniochaeta ligniaria NRRL 30616]|uniref:CBS-domain-containing protein n=1 Tax=Coniochaeta ligniaria NRRL 30616 TaxID=1408157 RepID=A0A1J7IQ53_9PEZI|nr:CBS-domain-containing protein [Coniochaeta ligniaria NRRL 30616]
MDDAPPSSRPTASETQATGNTSSDPTAAPHSATFSTLQLPTRTVGTSKQPDAAAGSETNPLAAAAARETTSHGHELPFVAPSSYLRRTPTGRRMADKHAGLSPLDRDQMLGLRGIREFLKVRNSYDVLPLSCRLIVFDNELLIKKSLNILIQNGIVSAPVWDSRTSTFAGLLTSTDYINVIQYYFQFPDEIDQVDQFRLSSLRDIEKAIGVLPLETVSVHPTRPLYEACRRMLRTRARRIPLVDKDDETGRETVISVITQYRILKFIAVNNEKYTTLLKKSVREIGLGTYNSLATETMSSSVLDAIHLMVKYNISAVPIVDKQNRLLNVFEAVDVIPCIKGGDYDALSSTIGEALSKRSEDFPGIYTCTEEDRLDSIFDTIRKSRVHRLIVIDDESRLRGMISLSDILKYVLLHGEEDDSIQYG